MAGNDLVDRVTRRLVPGTPTQDYGRSTSPRSTPGSRVRRSARGDGVTRVAAWQTTSTFEVVLRCTSAEARAQSISLIHLLVAAQFYFVSDKFPRSGADARGVADAAGSDRFATSPSTPGQLARIARQFQIIPAFQQERLHADPYETP